MDESALLSHAHDLLDRARKAGADHAEAAVAYHRNVEADIENSQIHTVQTSDDTVFGLRVLVGDSLGFVTANGTDDTTFASCVEEAVAQARTTPPDPFNGLPAPQQVGRVPGLFDETVTTLGVADVARLARELVDRVRASDARIRIDSGSVSAGVGSTALASTTGVSLTESGTSAQGYLFGMAVDGQEVASFDYDGDATRTCFDLEDRLHHVADRFVNKCLAGLGTTSGKSFHGSVVLSADAVGELIVPTLISAISAEAVRKGRSPLADHLGKSVAVARFSLIDDGTLPGGVASSAFDRDGIPIRRHLLVHNGELKTYLYNHYEARAAGASVHSTGHATGTAGTLPTIGPAHLEIPPGASSASDLEAGSAPVVYVGRFSGSTNPVTGDFSGVVKNGFLCEGGNRRPIRETLIAGNVFAALRSIEAISIERLRVASNHLFPALRIGGISVTAG